MTEKQMLLVLEKLTSARRIFSTREENIKATMVKVNQSFKCQQVAFLDMNHFPEKELFILGDQVDKELTFYEVELMKKYDEVQHYKFIKNDLHIYLYRISDTKLLSLHLYENEDEILLYEPFIAVIIEMFQERNFVHI